MNNRMNLRRRNNQYRRRRTNNFKRSKPRFTNRMEQVKLYKEPGDQTVTFKDCININNLATGEGGSGIYIKGYTVHTPYAALIQSSYAGIAAVYELFRVLSIKITVMIPGATYNVGGLSAAKMYRDGRVDNPNPFYEGLLQERLVQKGKLWKNYTFVWRPIEATDFDFIPVNSNADNGRFGQTNLAAVSIPPPFNKALTPFMELTYTLEFKYLKDPKVPTNLTMDPLRLNDYDLMEEQQQQFSPRPVSRQTTSTRTRAH